MSTGRSCRGRLTSEFASCEPVDVYRVGAAILRGELLAASSRSPSVGAATSPASVDSADLIARSPRRRLRVERPRRPDPRPRSRRARRFLRRSQHWSSATSIARSRSSSASDSALPMRARSSACSSAVSSPTRATICRSSMRSSTQPSPTSATATFEPAHVSGCLDGEAEFSRGWAIRGAPVTRSRGRVGSTPSPKTSCSR